MKIYSGDLRDYMILWVILVVWAFPSYHMQCRCRAFKLDIGRRSNAIPSRSPISFLYSKAIPNECEGQKTPDPSIVDELTSFAPELANAAGDAIIPYWRLKGVEVESKFETDQSVSQTVSPVTIADRSAEESMRKLIEARYPSHGIYGEELGQVRVDADLCGYSTLLTVQRLLLQVNQRGEF